jgi:hypothetical protein
MVSELAVVDPTGPCCEHAGDYGVLGLGALTMRNLVWRLGPRLQSPVLPRRLAGLLLATTALGVVSAHAQDASWVGNNAGDPNEWIENNNWTPATIPTGTATFTNNGAPTTVDADGSVSVNAITFTGAPNNAPAYTITMNDLFIVSGTGVSNNSTNTQTINNTV